VIERYRSIKSIDQIGFIDELDRWGKAHRIGASSPK